MTDTLNDKADYARKKKLYDLKHRTLTQKENERLISESSNKSKAIWAITNNERKSLRKATDSTWSLKIANEEVNNIHTISELFNNYFMDIAEETFREKNPPKTRVVKTLPSPWKGTFRTSLQPPQRKSVRS